MSELLLALIKKVKSECFATLNASVTEGQQLNNEFSLSVQTERFLTFASSSSFLGEYYSVDFVQNMEETYIDFVRKEVS